MARGRDSWEEIRFGFAAVRGGNIERPEELKARFEGTRVLKQMAQICIGKQRTSKNSYAPHAIVSGWSNVSIKGR